MRAACDLRPYADEQHGWWVASDLTEAATNEPLPQDHVLGIGGASTTLASWTPRPTGRHRARPRHRLRRAVAAPGLPRPLGDRHGPVLAGAGLRPVQRRAQRLDVGAAAGEPARARRRAALRPRRQQPAVRHHPARRPRCRCTSTATAGRPATRSCRAWCGPSASILEPGGIAQLLGNWEIGASAPTWRERVDAVAGRHRAGRLGDPARRAGPRRSTPRRGPATEGTCPGPTPSTPCTPRG